MATEADMEPVLGDMAPVLVDTEELEDSMELALEVSMELVLELRASVVLLHHVSVNQQVLMVESVPLEDPSVEPMEEMAKRQIMHQLAEQLDLVSSNNMPVFTLLTP